MRWDVEYNIPCRPGVTYVRPQGRALMESAASTETFKASDHPRNCRFTFRKYIKDLEDVPDVNIRGGS